MKRAAVLLAGLCVLAAPAAAVELKTLGRGDSLTFDPAIFSAELRVKYETVMKPKCVKCHSMERTVIAITTGVAPISGQPFDKTATKAYGVKMMRKPDADMTKEQVKIVVELMNYLLDEAAR
jgi:hypothetical protein